MHYLNCYQINNFNNQYILEHRYLALFTLCIMFYGYHNKWPGCMECEGGGKLPFWIMMTNDVPTNSLQNTPLRSDTPPPPFQSTSLLFHPYYATCCCFFCEKGQRFSVVGEYGSKVKWYYTRIASSIKAEQRIGMCKIQKI